jgi:hypothetical protein
MLEKIKKQTHRGFTLKRNIPPFCKVITYDQRKQEGTYRRAGGTSKGKDENLEKRKGQKFWEGLSGAGEERTDILGSSFFTRAESLECFYLKMRLSVRSYQTVLVQSAPLWYKKTASEDTVPDLRALMGGRERSA